MDAPPPDVKVQESLGAEKEPSLHDPTPACEEHCSATTEMLNAIDRKKDQQVRVVKDETKGEFALYPVTEEEILDPSSMPLRKIVRMGSPAGPQRLGDTVVPPFDATVDRTCVDTTQELDPPASDPTCALLMTGDEQTAKDAKGAKLVI